MSITAARLQVDVIANTSSAEQGIAGFSNKLNNAAKSARSVGTGMMAGITLPLLGIAAAGLQTAMQFETNMNVLQQAVGATAGEMEGLQAQALSLGATTVFSAGEAADAMVELGKAGMDSADIMASIGGVLNLAAAGGIGLAEAAGLTANALNAFGLEATESNRVADLFAATADASSANISDLGQGMRAAGFAFKLANQPIENLAASLGILTNVGLTGSDAGTALKNAFMRMMNPTNEAKDVMDKLGISFYDMNGNMKGLPDIIGMLNQAMTGLSSQQRDAALSTIFMSDGMKALLPLMDVGKEGFNAYVTEVSATGAASDAAAARMKGLSGGVEYLKGSVDSFLIGAALPFLGTLNGWVIAVADAITAFGGLDPAIVSAALALAGVLAVAGPLLVAIGLIAPALAAVGLPMIALGLGAAVLAAAWAGNFMGIQDATAAAATAVGQQLDVMKASMTSFGAAVKTAFGKTKFPTLDELWTDFKAGDFDTLATKIRTTAFDLMVNLDTELNIKGKATHLKQQLDGLVTGLTTAIDGIDFGEGSSTFAGMIDKLKIAVSTMDFSGIDWAGVLTGKLLGPIGLAISGIKWVMTSADFDGLRTAATGAIGMIKWGEIGTAFAGLGTAVLGQLKLISADIIADLSGAFTRATGIKVPEIKWIVAPGKAITLPYPSFIVSPSNPVTLPPPDFIMAPPKPVKVPEPKFDFNWENVGALPTKMINGVTDAFEGANWFGAGQVIGGAIGLWWQGEMGKLDFWSTSKYTPITDFNTWWNDLQIQIGAEMRSGFTASGFTDALSGLGTSISDAFSEMVAGFTSVLGIGKKNLADAASTSDILRDQQLGAAAFEWPPLPTFEWPDYVTWIWPNYTAWTWPDYVTWVWPKLPAFTWPSIPTPAWLSSLLGAGSAYPSGGGVPGEKPYNMQDESMGGNKGRYSIQRPSAQSDAPPLDWNAYITPLAWDTFVRELAWGTYLNPLLWPTYIPPLEWSAFVSPVDWGAFVPPVDWPTFVPTLAWNGFVTNLEWSTFVSSVNWGSYISDVSWGSYIPSMNWGNFVSYLDWGRFIPGLNLGGGGGTSPAPAAGGIAAAGVTVNLATTVANDMDVEAMALRIAQVIQRKMR